MLKPSRHIVAGRICECITEFVFGLPELVNVSKNLLPDRLRIARICECFKEFAPGLPEFANVSRNSCRIATIRECRSKWSSRSATAASRWGARPAVANGGASPVRAALAARGWLEGAPHTHPLHTSTPTASTHLHTLPFHTHHVPTPLLHTSRPFHTAPLPRRFHTPPSSNPHPSPPHTSSHEVYAGRFDPQFLSRAHDNPDRIRECIKESPIRTARTCECIKEFGFGLSHSVVFANVSRNSRLDFHTWQCIKEFVFGHSSFVNVHSGFTVVHI